MSLTPPPQGLTASKPTTAKGAELKFWIVKANEVAAKKVLNVSRKVDQLRADLARYYGLDLSMIPHPEAITVQTVDQDIRERQWADWEALGEYILDYCLLPSLDQFQKPSASIQLFGTQRPTAMVHSISRVPLPLNSSFLALGVEWKDTVRAGRVFKLIIDSTADSILLASHDTPDVLGVPPPALSSGALLNPANNKPIPEFSTADPSWPKYSNLVSKRERLHRILTNDFGGDKDRFFAFFATPPTARRKHKRTEEEPSESVPSQEHFRSFRKIVEAVPWCEANLVSERSKIEYYSGDGEFSEALWNAKWADKNVWEVWRAIGREHCPLLNFDSVLASTPAKDFINILKPKLDHLVNSKEHQPGKKISNL
ncbi:hypothetical protein B0H10DRAFT_1950725 [Mycena sp. CBHHK59/15]|nr:hypothetical protein B0H10DRAFT_1950725 [Mycena sp. CBHHK59/15]